MTNLDTLVPALQREVAVPGEFGTYFPDTLDEELTPALGDGFAQAQLEGWFPDVTLDTGTFVTTPDISLAGGQLVVYFTAMRMVRARLFNRASRESYRAGPAEYETEFSSLVMREILKDFRTKIDTLTKQAKSATAVYVIDSYMTRAATDWGAFYPYEVP